jgi:hypothetical protein
VTVPSVVIVPKRTAFVIRSTIACRGVDECGQDPGGSG